MRHHSLRKTSTLIWFYDGPPSQMVVHHRHIDRMPNEGVGVGFAHVTALTIDRWQGAAGPSTSAPIQADGCCGRPIQQARDLIWLNAGWLLVHRLRRLPNNHPALSQYSRTCCESIWIYLGTNNNYCKLVTFCGWKFARIFKVSI